MTEKKAIDKLAASGNPVSFHSVKVQGHTVSFAQTGNDSLPTLLFVHGSPGSWDAYVNYMNDSVLLSRYRIISLDRPGYGKSDKGKALRLPTQVDLVAKAYSTLENGKATYWAGHSLGGAFVTLMAERHSAQVDGIILLAASISPDFEKRETWRHVFQLNFISWLIPVDFRTCNTEIIYFKEDICLLDSSWKQIFCPALIVHGTIDPLVDFRNAPYAQAHLTNAPKTELVEIRGANHFIPWQHFDTIKKSILSFFEPSPSP